MILYVIDGGEGLPDSLTLIRAHAPLTRHPTPLGGS